MNYIRNNRLIKKVIKLFRNLTLKRKLLLLFYVQIIIPIVFIGIVAYSKSSINDNEVIIDNMEVSENIHRMKSRIGSEESNYFIDKSTNSLVSYVTLENPNWKIAYSISLKILYSEIENLRNGIFLIILLSIIVLSIISSLTALDIVNPINRLVEAMKNLEESGKHKYVYINRNDEIGYLAKTFNTMSYNIDNLVNVNYREKLTRKEAQLKALQSQINPHFIFNTLENINWLAQLNGVNEISITVTSLANLMEASIGKGRKNIYFSEELNYINSFIDIFNVRFPDKVTVVRNISEESLNVKIPKLLIEPIVENSLNHGLERISREGELMLSSEIYDNHLIVIVYDNGIGMDKDKLNRLISNMDNSDDDRNICNSIGLLNVNKRIKLFYGEEYGLNIESEKDKFTKVTVKIPINNMNGGE